MQVDVERRLDAFRQSVEHTNEKLTELTGVYDDVQVYFAMIFLENNFWSISGIRIT